MNYFFFVIISCLIYVHPNPAYAESPPLAITGYTKNLSTFTQSSASGENIAAILNRLRLEVKKQLDPWTFHLAVDNELLFHNFQNTAEFQFIRSRAQAASASWDWDQISADRAHHYSRHAVYRAAIQYYDPRFQITLGKQGIDWGVMRFYSPNDIFNTVGPIDLEYDERVGVDAININWAWDDFSGLNLVVVPDGDQEDAMAAVKLYTTLKTYDIRAIAGVVRNEVLAGITFDGYVRKAGLRGEIQYKNPETRSGYLRVSVGADYTFNEEFTLLMEHFYNEGASDRYAVFAASYLSSLQFLSAKKNLTSLWLTYQHTPLLTVNQYLLYDWDGGSVVYNPEIVYSLTDNTELKAGLQAYFGGDNSEFGDLEHLAYIQIQWFF